METKKELTAMDFLTFTLAGNVVVTDPVTGTEFLCLRKQDNAFVHTLTKEVLTADDICRAVMQRMAMAQKIDQEIDAAKEAKAQPAAPEQAPPTWQPRFCIRCGAPLGPTDKFCMRCGTAVQPAS